MQDSNLEEIINNTEVADLGFLIKNCQEGKEISFSAFIGEFNIGTKKDKSKFATLILTDGKTSLPVKLWDGQISLFQEAYQGGCNYLRNIHCGVSSYEGNKQLSFKGLKLANFITKNNDFLYDDKRCEDKDLDDKFNYFLDKLSPEHLEIVNQSINLLNKKHNNFIFGKEYDFTNSSGSPFQTHHNFETGLYVHTIEVCQHAEHILKSSEFVMKKFSIDESLLYTMCILHDIGKPVCYKRDGSGGFDRTFEEMMLKHTVVGSFIVYDGIKRAKKKMGEKFSLDDKDCMLILHGVLSHNGKKEWGSPVEPYCIEAYLAHQADMLSCGVGNFTSGFDGVELDKEKHSETSFPNKILRKKFYLKGN